MSSKYVTTNVTAKPVTFLHETNHCSICGLSHVQLSNSYCLKTTHRVTCRTDAVNNLSRSLENHFLSKLIFIKISESVIPHQTLFQPQLGYVQHLTWKSSGVTDVGQGRAATPGKLNVKTGPPLADILICSILSLFSIFLRFSVFCFLASIDFHDLRIHYHFLTFFSQCWLVPSLR